MKISIVPHVGGQLWVVQEGRKKPIISFDTKEEAENHGRSLARIRECKFVVYREDGSLEKKTNFINTTLPFDDYIF